MQLPIKSTITYVNEQASLLILKYVSLNIFKIKLAAISIFFLKFQGEIQVLGNLL